MKSFTAKILAIILSDLRWLNSFGPAVKTVALIIGIALILFVSIRLQSRSASCDQTIAHSLDQREHLSALLCRGVY